MAPHKPRKSTPVEYTTDEEDMILYDIEEEVESAKSRIIEDYGKNIGKMMRNVGDRVKLPTWQGIELCRSRYTVSPPGEELQRRR
ncbi:hypothetical protein TNCV_2769331 [Trichonephila clavipes]|nr:hypothetical protein TNCV_2769331 [Trichonephila clavipes]